MVNNQDEPGAAFNEMSNCADLQERRYILLSNFPSLAYIIPSLLASVILRQLASVSNPVEVV